MKQIQNNIDKWKEKEERLAQEVLLAKRNKNKRKVKNGVASNITFDFKGKLIYMKKVNEENLPSMVNIQSKIKRKLERNRQENRPEDKPQDKEVEEKTNELIK